MLKGCFLLRDHKVIHEMMIRTCIAPELPLLAVHMDYGLQRAYASMVMSLKTHSLCSTLWEPSYTCMVMMSLVQLGHGTLDHIGRCAKLLRTQFINKISKHMFKQISEHLFKPEDLTEGWPGVSEKGVGAQETAVAAS